MQECKNNNIELLRSVLCLIIIFYHYIYRFQMLYCGYIDPALSFMQLWGDIGVVSFLMLSVFLYNPIKFKTLREMLTKKIKRLWGDYAIAVFVIFIVLRIFPLRGREVSIIKLIFNLLMINPVMGIPYIDGAHWYITTLIVSYTWLYIVSKRKQEELVFFAWLILACMTHFLPEPVKNISVLFEVRYCGLIILMYLCKNYTELLKLYYDERIRFFFRIALIISSLAYSLLKNGLIVLFVFIISILVITYLSKQKDFFERRTLIASISKYSYLLYLLHQNLGYVIQSKLMEKSGCFHVYYSFVSFFIVLIMAILISIIKNSCKKWRLKIL